MEDKGDVIKYYRNFNLLSKPLLDARRITTGERNAAFILGFHLDDRKVLRERLIAKKPDMPKGHAFDIKDILDTARAVFSSDDDFFGQEQPIQRHEPDRSHEQKKEHPPLKRHNQDEDNTSSQEEDSYERTTKSHQPLLHGEMQNVHFKTTSRESEEKELDKLIRQLYSCLVRDPKYISLYSKCLLHFPDITREIPKLEHWREPLSAAYSYQAMPLIAPMQQHWSTHALTPPRVSAHPLPVASLADSFFHSCPTGFIFCGHQGHQIRVCRAMEDYIRSGRATMVNNHLHLPNFQPIPYDGTGRGIKASLDTWLATQTMPMPAPAPPAAQTHIVFA